MSDKKIFSSIPLGTTQEFSPLLSLAWSYWETVLKRKVSLRNAGWDDQKHVKLFDAKSGKELVSKLATMPSVP